MQERTGEEADGPVAGGLECFGQRLAVPGQPARLVVAAVHAIGQAGEEGGVGRKGPGAGTGHHLEERTLGGQPVEGGAGGPGVPVATKMVGAERVDGDQDHAGPFGRPEKDGIRAECGHGQHQDHGRGLHECSRFHDR